MNEQLYQRIIEEELDQLKNDGLVDENSLTEDVMAMIQERVARNLDEAGLFEIVEMNNF